MYEWEESDPLADIFLCGYGGFPAQEDTGIDYLGMVSQNLIGARNIIQNGSEIQIPHIARETIASLNHTYIQTHYTIRNHWDYPGFYIGEADNFTDLVNFWNLREAQIPLQFFDPGHTDRLNGKANAWTEHVRQVPPRMHGPQGLAIWHRANRPIDDVLSRFGTGLAWISQP